MSLFLLGIILFFHFYTFHALFLTHFFLFFVFFHSFKDPVASPVEYGKFYSEKFIYMPHSFLANSFAHQHPDMQLSSVTLPKDDDPASNKCNIMVDVDNDHGDKSSSSPSKEPFIFCNFNKHLKFDPDLFTHWLDTVEAVENSYLCLLENPDESKEFITEFTKNHSPNLIKRIGYLPYMNNPYENQQRNARFCHVILDTTIYNGHTTAADALWGGVPVVTRGDGVDMGSRVGASILTALNLTELIGSNQGSYNDIALKLAQNKDFYKEIRAKLIRANHAKSPMNPFWDLQRYVRNLESGFETVWDTFIHGRNIEHVYVADQGSNNSSVVENDTYREIVDDIEDTENVPRQQDQESRTKEKAVESSKKNSRTATAGATKKRKQRHSSKKQKAVKKNQRASRRRKRRKNGRSKRRSLSEEL